MLICSESNINSGVQLLAVANETTLTVQWILHLLKHHLPDWELPGLWINPTLPSAAPPAQWLGACSSLFYALPAVRKVFTLSLHKCPVFHSLFCIGSLHATAFRIFWELYQKDKVGQGSAGREDNFSSLLGQHDLDCKERFSSWTEVQYWSDLWMWSAHEHKRRSQVPPTETSG